jgi:hypothetical protein
MFRLFSSSFTSSGKPLLVSVCILEQRPSIPPYSAFIYAYYITCLATSQTFSSASLPLCSIRFRNSANETPYPPSDVCAIL